MRRTAFLLPLTFMTSIGVAASGALVGCGAGRTAAAPSVRVSQPATVASPDPVSAKASAAEARSDVYLPADAAEGSPYCLNPQSQALRAFVARPRFEEDEALSAPALAEDVRDLHGAMKKMYAGYPELLQSSRFDVERFFFDWEQRARRAGKSITFGEGIVRPLVTLKQNIQDNHLLVWGWAGRLAARPDLAFAEYQAAGVAAPIDEAHCAFGEATPVRGTLRAARSISPNAVSEIATFSARAISTSIDVRCGDRAIRFERRPYGRVEAKGEAPAYAWRTIGDATVITVRRLDGSPEDRRMLEQLAKDYDEHRRNPVIVFDFRGNGGGDDGYVSDWIRRAKRGTWPAPYTEVQVVGGRKPCGDWNAAIIDQILYKRVDDTAARAERDALRAALVTSPNDPVIVSDAASSESHATAPYAGRIFVLVDHASASSAESAPDLLRIALGATIVGERTGGYAEFGNVRPYVMPRTGVTWVLASKRNYYGSPHDGVGLAVDLYLDPHLLALPVDAILPLLEKLPKKSPGLEAHGR
jgi:hypothetical protein